MTAQSGQDVLLKIDVSGSGEFRTVAGLKATKIALNAQSVEITHQTSPGRWRELLQGGGIKTASLSGSGIFVDSECDTKFREAFFAGDMLQAQLCLPDFGILEGAFQLTALEYNGNFDGEMQFEIALLSAGALSFTEISAEVSTNA